MQACNILKNFYNAYQVLNYFEIYDLGEETEWDKEEWLLSFVRNCFMSELLLEKPLFYSYYFTKPKFAQKILLSMAITSKFYFFPFFFSNFARL